MWTTSEVLDALSSEFSQQLDSQRLNLPLYDRSSRCGVGRDHEGRFVAIFPSEPELPGFEIKNASYEPVRMVRIEQAAESEVEVSVLRIELIVESESLSALSGVFSTLFNVSERRGSAGKIIWLLRDLFASQLKGLPSLEVVTGLVGELVAILASSAPSNALKAWHSNPNDRYDFSADNHRVEVKASLTQRRTHHFSSSQLPSPKDVKLTVLSVLVDQVQVGQNIEDLVSEISVSIEPLARQHLIEVVTEILKCPPVLVGHFVFDSQSARLNVKAFAAADIPTVHCGLSITSASWTCSLDGISEMQESDVAVLLGRP